MADRTLAIPAQAGSSAQTVIPDNPTPGTAYRNASLAVGTINQGWPYDTVVDSADQNQLMYLITGLLRLLEQTGILPWCATVAYPSAGVFCLGSDNQLYISLQASTGKNPTTEAAYWSLYSATIRPAKASGATVFSGTLAAADTFQDLDLSAVVGSRTALVNLEIYNSGSPYAVRPKGFGAGGTSAADHYGSGGSWGGAMFNANEASSYGYLTVMTNAAGVIQHACNSHTQSVVVKVVGYI
jgi:hypothetical protein